jgi:alkylation response protein AidB-like acyl-CoA dehydrogenase
MSLDAMYTEAAKWKEIAHEIAEKHVRPVAKKYDDLQEYPTEIKDALKEAGLFGVWIPKEYGGHGAGVLSLCMVVEERSRACPGVGVLFAVNALGSFPLILSGTEEQKQKWLPQIAAGEKLCAFCLSEKVAGSDAGSLQCRAEQDGDDWVITGEKKWTTNGGQADLYTVFCVTDPESRSRRISALLVEKGTEGFTFKKIEDKMGIRCVPVAECLFENVRVSSDHLLGGKPGLGFKHAMQTLDNARPGVAAQGVGCAQGALELGMVYANRRQQFGKVVASFQMIQQILADSATQIEAARQLVYASAIKMDTNDPQGNKFAAMGKTFATDVAMKVSTDMVQVFGGYGFMKDYPIEKYMRDAKITQIYEGTNQVQRLVIARNLTREVGNYDFLNAFIPDEEQFGVEAKVEEEVASA